MARILLWRRTEEKSLTVTLWLISITASNPGTAGLVVVVAWAVAGGVGGACRPAQPVTVKPASPASAILREIIPPTSSRSQPWAFHIIAQKSLPRSLNRP